MKILLTGVCGFAGSTIAAALLESRAGLKIIGVDNLSRPGSELNRRRMRELGVDLRHLDIRSATDLETIEPTDWVIDAAANPSVLAGVTEGSSSRQVIEHNLGGTINLLEYCKTHRAGFILLSTSRVYSIPALAGLKMTVQDDAYRPLAQKVAGFGARGVAEEFSTEPPLSLYGTAKRASEQLALEYSNSFHFPVYINRCGVMAGAGQFGKANQGIFSYWIHSYRSRRPLHYIGFNGRGAQVRDCLHPRDLVPVLLKQMRGEKGPAVCNFGGGVENSMSLRQLTDWCARRFGPHKIGSERRSRPFDVPWLVLDASKAAAEWNWRPQTKLEAILEEIAIHAETFPDWLDVTD
jgi:CDP-paratose 2-epimerase